MNISSFSKIAIIVAKSTDVLALSPTEMEVSVGTTINSTDTFELDGVTHTIDRVHQAEPHIKAKFENSGKTDTEIKNAFLNNENFTITIDDVSISDTTISGDVISITSSA